MTRQSLVSIGVLAAAAAVVVCSAGSALAQGDYVVPRTEYGHPDLQGFWTNQTYTPASTASRMASAAKGGGT